MQINSNFSAKVKWPKNKKDKDVIKAVPTNISDLLKDDDKNGIPDFADEIVKQSKGNHQSKNFSKTYININGKTFNNMADATKYATENIPALKLVNKMFNNNPFFSSKSDDVVIDGEIVNTERVNKTFDKNQRINSNSKNLPKATNKIDLILGLIILALVFVVVFYFIFQ